ncbi:MAG TPA: sulfatase [Anaerolineaceae bacterium]
MRILYIDIDTTRADHLSCYGYHRKTTPNIDAIAAQGVRFDNCYVPDAPCLPSRSALWSGQFGFRNGAINHGGTAADMFIEGKDRGFRSVYGNTNWMTCLRQAGLRTITVSPFAERHSAWQWYGGYVEMYNTMYGGMEGADDVTPTALDWIKRNAKNDNWFLHVNYWDPHTPYRTPLDFGNPFESDSLPAWLTEEYRQKCWGGIGSHSAQELHDYPGDPKMLEAMLKRYPRLPRSLDSMDAVRKWIDGYDTGIRYADEHAGRLLNALADQNVLDDLVIMISSDHGENQGELNIWGDHQTADEPTCHIPLIVRWPGMGSQGRADPAFVYPFDWAATMIELVGGKVPSNWDGRSFASAFQNGVSKGRPYLVTSQAAWACQRGVRFHAGGEEYLCLRTYHDGHKYLDPIMLFNLTVDPHEQNDISSQRPDLVNLAMKLLTDWQSDMMLTSRTNVDPMMTVLREGGPLHTRGKLPKYLDHLRNTGRQVMADRLASLHPDELK